MFNKTYHATEPNMTQGVSTEQVRDQYTISGLFAADEVKLNYAHHERFVFGGAAPEFKPVTFPHQSVRTSAKGHPDSQFLRGMGSENVDCTDMSVIFVSSPNV